MTDNPNYKITFMLDSAAMITVHTPKRGVVEVSDLSMTAAGSLPIEKKRSLRGSGVMTYMVAVVVCNCVCITVNLKRENHVFISS